MTGSIPNKFLVTEKKHKLSFTPKFIQLANQNNAFYVACKDGTVLYWDFKDKEPRKFPPEDKEGRRCGALSLCEVKPGEVLVGRNDGSLDLIDFKKKGEEKIITGYRPKKPKENPEAISYMIWLDADHFFVFSSKNGGAVIPKAKLKDWCENSCENSKVEQTHPPWGGQKFFRDMWNIIGATSLTLDDGNPGLVYMFISSTGNIWTWDPYKLKNENSKGFEFLTGNSAPLNPKPAIVFDIAFEKEYLPKKDLKRDLAIFVHPKSALYAATDFGVYRLTAASKNGEIVIQAKNQVLPGLTDIPVSCTYCLVNQEREGLLWVVDSRGETYLFQRPLITPGQEAIWERIGAFKPAPGVIQSFGAWNTKENEFIVGQIRRMDQAVIGTYRAINSNEEVPREDGNESEQKKLLLQRLFAGQCIPVSNNCLFGELKRFVEEEENTTEFQNWAPEAILADFFEIVAEKEEWRPYLLEFLSHPNNDLAECVFTEMPKPEVEADLVLLFGEAISLWCYALMGVIHRNVLESHRRTAFLGLIRWLQILEECSIFKEKTETPNEITRIVEKNIRLAYKWGVFNEIYSFRDSVRQQHAILEQMNDPAQTFHRLVYACKLFYDRVNIVESKLESADNPGNRVAQESLGKRANRLQVCNFGRQVIAAVSWKKKGLDFFQADGPKGLKTPKFLAAEGLSEDCACLYLWESGEKLFGLFMDESKQKGMTLKTAELAFTTPEPASIAITWGPQEFSLAGKKPISCSCVMEFEEKKLLLIGLRGSNNNMALFRLPGSNLENGDFLTELSLPTVTPIGVEIVANAIVAMARVRHSASGGIYEFFAGCEDGRVWHCCFGPDIENLRPDGLIAKEVGRLSVPITALSCDFDSGLGFRRVFVGGSDGTILAWQEKPPGSDEEREDNILSDLPKMKYGSIWATKEQTPITAIHMLLTLGETQTKPAQTEPTQTKPALVAVTRGGKCVVIDNRRKIENFSQPDKCWRPRIPGNRISRCSLKMSALVSHVFPPKNSATGQGAANGKPKFNDSFSMWVASGDGQLVCFVFDYLDRRQSRGKKQKEIMALWHTFLSSGKPRLRQAEIAYPVAPAFPLVYVRGILSPPPGSQLPELLSMEAGVQHFPRIIRHLFHFKKTWDPNRIGGELEGLKDGLRILLERVVTAKDELMYKELVTVILKECNFRLFKACETEENIDRVAVDYQAILEVLKQAVERWIGAPGDVELRIKMTIAKNLVDGKTFASILAYLRGRKPHSEQNENEKPLPPNKEPPPEELPPIDNALKIRIGWLRELLGEAGPLLALETLRACNLSITRARLWLNEKGKSTQEIDWDYFAGYFDTVADFAGRTAQSRTDAKDALQHEIARSFAIGLYIIPSSAMKFAHRVAEIDLSNELIRLILEQFEMLRHLGLKTNDEIQIEAAKTLFMLASYGDKRVSLKKYLEGILKYDKNVNFNKEERAIEARKICDFPKDKFENRLESICGKSNANILWEYYCYDQMIQRVETLKENILNNPEKINFPIYESDCRRDNKIEDFFKDSGSVTKETCSYYHTHQFWKFAFSDLKTQLKYYRVTSNIKGINYCWLNWKDVKKLSYRKSYTTPEMVLACKPIEVWCENCLNELESSYEKLKIFEPERGHWRNLFNELKEAVRQFPASATLQKHLIRGVLNHGLLEKMDELVFELEEIAYALDPLMYKLKLDQPGEMNNIKDQYSGPDDATEHRFADYLLTRAADAETIPKNLRTLIMLVKDNPTWSGKDIKGIVENLATRNSMKIDPPGNYEKIKDETLEFNHWLVGLILSELFQNQRMHTKREAFSVKYFPAKSSLSNYNYWKQMNNKAKNRSEPLLLLHFPLNKHDKTNYDRLIEIMENQSQIPISSREDRVTPSHGTGLYLANFAAALVNHRFLLIEVTSEEATFFLFKVKDMFKVNDLQGS